MNVIKRSFYSFFKSSENRTVIPGFASYESLLLISLLLWFLRMVLPGIKFIFIPIFIVQLILFSFKFYTLFLKKSFVIEFLKSFLPLAVLCVFFLIGLLQSTQLYRRSLFDLFELVVVVLFLFSFFVLTYCSRKQEYFNKLFFQMVAMIGYSALFIAIIGLIKFTLQITGILDIRYLPYGTAFNTDQNFYALYSFLGIISITPKFCSELKLYKRFLFQFFVLILSLNILLSNSYRSFVLLSIGAIGVIGFQIFGLFSEKGTTWHFFSKNTNLLFLLILLVFITGLGYIEQVPENKWMEALNIYNGLNLTDIIDKGFQIDRWRFAIEYFNNQDFLHKLVGSGFDYLTDFGRHFYADPARLDYPHNPILSSLLYSGIIGAIFASLFLIISLFYSILYFRKYPLFGLMLWVSFLFVFFSGNSLFSVPVFLFLFSLSFLIRHQEITDLHIDFNLNKPGSKLVKEMIDYFAATIALIIFLPILILIALLILITMGWPIFYSQVRVGQNGKTFKLHKFRSMKHEKSISSIAAIESNRISVLGKVLRKTKLDELPELWNIIRRDMSFVGPRPDVPGYADSLKGESRELLTLKPGLTGPASLKYINEDELLALQQDPQKYNDEVIFPDKIRINLAYMKYWSFWLDLKIIIFTALRKPLNEEYFK